MSKLGLVIFTVSFCIIVVLGIRRIIINNKNLARGIIQRFNFFLHPNAITIWGGFTSIAGMIFYYFDYPDLGVTLFIIGAFADMLDGTVAREAGLITPLGKILDPFVDKISYLVPLIYFAFEGTLSWKLVLAFTLIDFLGQYLRNAVHLIHRIGLGFATAANKFGKIKTILALALVVYCFLLKQHLGIPNFADHTLWVVFTLAVLSVAFKFKKLQATKD